MTTTSLPLVPQLTLADVDELRAHLDRLNETGTGYMAAGVDANGEPFLAFLMGVYAESVGVLAHNPWDPEVDVRDAYRMQCDCNAQAWIEPDKLDYPLYVLAPNERPED